MPTPNVYAQGLRDPLDDVPPELRSNRVEVLYLTDRARENDTARGAAYGISRSRSVAFGTSDVQFGSDDEVSWDELVSASKTSKRSVRLDIRVVRTQELGRFPPTPRTLIEVPPEAQAAPDATTQPATSSSALDADSDQALAECRRELEARLAKTPVKEVYVFIHGVKNNFEQAVSTIAELWHFLGRQGVPIAYSWPAGAEGLLRGYNYDYNSSEFTVYHLKQSLRAIASCPSVRKIHIIAHSRGTDVAISALRELYLEYSGGGKSTRDELKLGRVVLAAPDLDVDVVLQRAVTARLAQVPEHTVLYICDEDKALGVSRWLFGGMRLGKLKPDIFTPGELEALRNSKHVAIVDALVTRPGWFGHNYFYANPAVSSDLILALRYGKLPGAENGRPLGIEKNGFWVIRDGYPKEQSDAATP